MAEFLRFAALFVLASGAAGLLRILWGPGRADRMMAAELLSTAGIAALLLWGTAARVSSTIDVALTVALLAAFASATFVRALGEVNRNGEREQR